MQKIVKTIQIFLLYIKNVKKIIGTIMSIKIYNVYVDNFFYALQNALEANRLIIWNQLRFLWNVLAWIMMYNWIYCFLQKLGYNIPFFGICLKSFDIYKGIQKLCTVRLNSKINVLINLFVKVCKLIISLILQLVYMIYQVANLPQTQIVNIQYTYKYM